MGFAGYFVIWWIALFLVLPWGVTRNANPVDGQDPGAPVNPHIKRKFLATTILSAIIWAGIYGMIQAGWIDGMVKWMWGML